MKQDGYKIVSEGVDLAYAYAKELAKIQRKWGGRNDPMKSYKLSIEYATSKLSIKNAFFRQLPKPEQTRLMKKAHRMLTLQKSGKLSAAAMIAASIIAWLTIKKKSTKV